MNLVQFGLLGDADQHRKNLERVALRVPHEGVAAGPLAVILAYPGAKERPGHARLDPRRSPDAAAINRQHEMHAMRGPVEERSQLAQRRHEQLRELSWVGPKLGIVPSDQQVFVLGCVVVDH